MSRRSLSSLWRAVTLRLFDNGRLARKLGNDSKPIWKKPRLNARGVARLKQRAKSHNGASPQQLAHRSACSMPAVLSFQSKGLAFAKLRKRPWGNDTRSHLEGAWFYVFCNDTQSGFPLVSYHGLAYPRSALFLWHLARRCKQQRNSYDNHIDQGTHMYTNLLSSLACRGCGSFAWTQKQHFFDPC